MSTAAAPRRLEWPDAWRRLPDRLCANARRWLRPAPRDEPDVARLLAEAPQAVPRMPAPDADLLPRIAAASLALHALILLTAVWRERQAPAPPQEIAVELVQAPEAKTKPAKTKPAEPKPVEPKPAEPETKQEPRQKPPEPQRKPQPQKAQARKSAKALRHPPPPVPRASDTPSPMPVRALPGALDTAPGADAVSYSQLVLSKLAKAKKEGRYVGVPGYAGVRFRLADDGSIESVNLVTSSGDRSLEIEAVAMVKRAAPYPPPPPGGRRDYGITLRFEARP